MMRKRLDMQRVLSIDPTARGFAYALLDGSEKLLDWGLKEPQSDASYRAKIERLLELSCPDVLVLEEIADSRRGEHARGKLLDLEACARARRIKVRRVTRARIREIFKEAGRSKRDIALAISRWFTELEDEVPRKRRIWESEDRRMAIFSAISLSLTLMREEERTRSEHF